MCIFVCIYTHKHVFTHTRKNTHSSVDGIRLDAAARKKYKQTVAEQALMKKSTANAAKKIEDAIANHQLTTK